MHFFHYCSDVTAQIMFSIHSGTSPSHINSTVQTVSVGITGILMLLNMYSKQWDMGSNLTLSLCPWKDTELSLESSCSPVLWLLSAFVWMMMWRICIVWPHARPKQWVKRAACAEHKWIGPSLPCHFWHAGIMIRVGDVLKADRMQHVSELILNGGRKHVDEYSDQGLIRVQNGLIITSKNRFNANGGNTVAYRWAQAHDPKTDQFII